MCTILFFIGMPTELVRDLSANEVNYIQSVIRSAFRTILSDKIESMNFAEEVVTPQGNKRFKQFLWLTVKESVDLADAIVNWEKYIPLEGIDQPMKVTMASTSTRMLELKPCCLRKNCVLNKWEKCDAYDKYHAKGGKRGYADGKFANPAERKAAKKAEQEEKRAAKEAMDEVLQSKELCRWAKKGRCKRGFPTSEMGCKFLHSEPHTYKDIKCASNLFRECYFTPTTCPYLDHKDTLDEQIGNHSLPMAGPSSGPQKGFRRKVQNQLLNSSP